MVVTRLSLTRIPLEESYTAEIANGSTETIAEKTNIESVIMNDTNICYTVECQILKTSATEVLLGMSFLMTNDAVINLKEGILILDGKKYEIILRNNLEAMIDRQIINKSKIFQCENAGKIKLDIQKLCAPYREKAITLGKIKESEHEIKLKNTAPISLKGFKLPIHTLEMVRKELKTLMEAEVI